MLLSQHPYVPQVGHLNPFIRTEAECIEWESGLKTERDNKTGMYVTDIDNGDFIKVKGVDFGKFGAATFTSCIAGISEGNNIELHLDSLNGKLIGTVSVPNTGGWQDWKNVTTSVSGAKGDHDLFFVFKGNSTGHLFNFDYWQFGKKTGNDFSE